MNLKSGIFILVAVVACSLTAEANAQIAGNGNGLGRQAASRVARFYVGRSIGFPANLVFRYAARNTGARLGGGQALRAGNQRNQFGNVLQAGRFFRRR